MSTALSPLNNLIQDLFGPNAVAPNASAPAATGADAGNNSSNNSVQDIFTLTGGNAGGQSQASILFEQASIFAEQPAFSSSTNAATNAAANQAAPATGNTIVAEEATLLIADFTPAEVPATAQQPAANPAPVAAAASNATAPAAAASTANTADTTANANAALLASANTGAAANANAAVISANSTAATAAPQTPEQQQMQQFDQVLQSLGFNPATIPVFNQLAMLLYENDPAALKQFIQTLQGGIPQPSNTGGAAGANAQNQAATPNTAQAAATAPAGNQATAQNQAPPQNANQSAGALAVEAISLQVVFAPADAATPAPGGNNQVAPVAQTQITSNTASDGANGTTAANNGFAAQFRHLQASFQEFNAGAQGTAGQPQGQSQNQHKALAAGTGADGHSHRHGLDLRA